MDGLDSELNRLFERLGVRRERADEAQATGAMTTADLLAAVDQMRRDTLGALLPRVRPEVLNRLSAVLASLDYRQPAALQTREERAVLTLQVLALVLSLLRPAR